MSGPRQSGRLRQRWERTPLRVRLVSAVLVLVTGALVLTGIANVTSLQSYMTNQVDKDLDESMRSLDVPGMTSELGSDSQRDGAIINYNVYVALTRDAEVHTIAEAEDSEAWPQLTYEDIRDNAGEGAFMRVSADGSMRWRILSQPLLNDAANTEGFVALAAPMKVVDAAVASLIWIDLLVGAGVLAGLAAIGVGLVRASLYPLKEMEHTATAIAGGDLSQRVPDRDPGTEVGRLALVFNQMLGRIESALAAREASEERARASEERMRRFVADASHELRTPLTTVRGFAELYRQRGDVPSAEVAPLMRRIEDEATRMGLLVDDLLLLARMDAERPFQLKQVDLLSVAVDTVAATEVTAGDRQISVATEGGPFLVRGDEMRLRQVASNLVTNAVRYTPSDARIDVSLSTQQSWVELRVRDNGPGMSEEQAQRVFERFYRVDKARSRSAGGTGLGLAIVAAIVDAHGGEVDVFSRPGEGASFSVRLAMDPDVHEGWADEADPSS